MKLQHRERWTKKVANNLPHPLFLWYRQMVWHSSSKNFCRSPPVRNGQISSRDAVKHHAAPFPRLVTTAFYNTCINHGSVKWWQLSWTSPFSYKTFCYVQSSTAVRVKAGMETTWRDEQRIVSLRLEAYLEKVVRSISFCIVTLEYYLFVFHSVHTVRLTTSSPQHFGDFWTVYLMFWALP